MWVLVAGATLLAAPARLRAQERDTTPSVCLGFSFGPWTPPLDWRGAGHERYDTSQVPHAPGGRDWAAGPVLGEADSVLVLFPSWWPVGVSVELPTRTPAPGDTVTGRARAFVADGRMRVPTSRVRAWRVSCAR